MFLQIHQVSNFTNTPCSIQKNANCFMMLLFLFAFTYHTYSVDSSKTFAQDDNVEV